MQLSENIATQAENLAQQRAGLKGHTKRVPLTSSQKAEHARYKQLKKDLKQLVRTSENLLRVIKNKSISSENSELNDILRNLDTKNGSHFSDENKDILTRKEIDKTSEIQINADVKANAYVKDRNYIF
jgi:hypothetical protein